MSGVGLAEGLIEATDWENYRRIAGVSAAGVEQFLMSLLKSDRERVEPARHSVENEIVHQANLYNAAEPAVSIVAASLADPWPRWVRIAVPPSLTDRDQRYRVRRAQPRSRLHRPALANV
jgi:hypothetical protein